MMPLLALRGGAKIKKSDVGAAFFTTRGAKTQGWGRCKATFSRTQNQIIEICLGTFQPRDSPYLPICFIKLHLEH